MRPRFKRKAIVTDFKFKQCKWMRLRLVQFPIFFLDIFLFLILVFLLETWQYFYLLFNIIVIVFFPVNRVPDKQNREINRYWQYLKTEKVIHLTSFSFLSTTGACGCCRSPNFCIHNIYNVIYKLINYNFFSLWSMFFGICSWYIISQQ